MENEYATPGCFWEGTYTHGAWSLVKTNRVESWPLHKIGGKDKRRPWFLPCMYAYDSQSIASAVVVSNQSQKQHTCHTLYSNFILECRRLANSHGTRNIGNGEAAMHIHEINYAVTSSQNRGKQLGDLKDNREADLVDACLDLR